MVLNVKHVYKPRKSAVLLPFVCFTVLRVFCAFIVFSISATAYCQVQAFAPANNQAPPVWSQIITHETRAVTKEPPHGPAKQWIFDQSLFSNNPATGRRIVQYEHGTPAYRDPNAYYDSPHESYPFSPAPYGPYPRFAPPRYYGDSAYDQYSFPYRPYAALPDMY